MRIKGLPIVRSGFLLVSSGVRLPKRDEGDTADPNAAGDDTDTGDDGDLGRVNVQFSPVDTPYEINSFWEGRFIERTKWGTFKKTIAESKRGDGTFGTKMLFNHGSDLTIGDKPLAVADRFAMVDTSQYRGPELEGPLVNTDYNRDQIRPLLAARALGSSFMFEVISEIWRNEPEPSDTNPEGLPERDILEARVFEAGPVTWPASPTASAGLRSRCGTDGWMEQLQTRNAARYDDLVRSFEAFRALSKTPDYKPGTPALDTNPVLSRQVDEATKRAAVIRARRIELMKAGY